jgi:2-hydroxymuconate-semialdehyde hydrolase
VIALDLPGYGYSDKPADARYTIDAQAYAVVSLMNRLEIDEATIIGASYGGAVAATIALDYPERVTNLILIGAVNNNAPMKRLLPRVAQLPLLGDIVTPLFLGSRWMLRKRMEDTYRHNLDEHKLAARHHLLAAADTHRAMLRTLRRWNANRIEHEAHQIHRPTLILWGEDDRHIPLSDGVRLREAIAGARLIVFRNCGHLPQVEQPAKFVEVVVNFCREESQAGALASVESKRKKAQLQET